MKQKLIQIGTSSGVTIPKEGMEMLSAQVGDMVETEVDTKAKTFTIKFSADHHSPVDPRIIEWTDEFIAKNRNLLERLKNK